jgi:hypothetical protein
MTFTATVTAVGTPSMIRSTTGSVTGTWSGDQPRQRGNLLVAVVTAGGSTASAAHITGPGGWWAVATAANDPARDGNGFPSAASFASASVYYRIAAGGETAPAFTATLTGTTVMTCTLLELAGVDIAGLVSQGGSRVPVEAAGTYSSGASTPPLTPVTIPPVPTGVVTTSPGGYLLAVYCQQAAAGTAGPWTGPSGWVNLQNDLGTSSVLHTAVDAMPRAVSGTAPSETVQWANTTSAHGAGIVVAFPSQCGGTDVFANEASTLVTATGDAGGTPVTGSHPAPGTPEHWTADWSSSFPAADPTAAPSANAGSPPACFRVADPANPAETMLVADTTSGLVIRGVDGTPTVAHTPPFTVQNVVSAGVLNRTSPQQVDVPPPTGNAVTDSANIRAALRAGSAASCSVFLGNGDYRLDGSQLAIPDNVTLVFRTGTTLLVNCTAGPLVDAITIGNNAGISGEVGNLGSQALIWATGGNCRTIISNVNHVQQEFAFIRNVSINLGADTTLAVAVVEFNAVFVNSGIRDVNISPGGHNVPAGTPGLLITGGPANGFGPLYVQDVWIVNCNGPCMMITENNPPNSSGIFWGRGLDLEHPAFPYHNLEIVGHGALESVIIDQLHTENNNTTTSGHVAGVHIDGATNVLINGYDILAQDAANKYGVWVTGSAARCSVHHLTNANNVIPIRDEIAGQQTAQNRDVAHWYGPGNTSVVDGTMRLVGDLQFNNQPIPAASTAVDPKQGTFINVDPLTANVTVAAPLNPWQGQLLIYRFVQNSTGGFTVSWDPVFKVAPNVVSTTGGKISVVTFIWDAALLPAPKWVQVSATTGV